MPLGLLEGLVCDAVVGPPDNSALYGTHYFPPECGSSAAPSTWRFLGLSEDVADIGVLIGFVCSLKENDGLVAHLTDLVALAPHPAAAPLPAAAVAAAENPADPASWTAPFSLPNSAFSGLSDEDGFMGSYAALSLASGVAGITAERRGEPFSSSPGCSKMSLLASALALSARGHATPSAPASASSLARRGRRPLRTKAFTWT